MVVGGVGWQEIVILVGAVVVLGAIIAAVVYFIMRSGGDEHQ